MKNNPMTEERYKETGFKMTYQEYLKCDCTICEKIHCIHKGSYRRVPHIDGGLGLYPNLLSNQIKK